MEEISKVFKQTIRNYGFKYCNDCDQPKLFSEFYTNPHNRDNLSSQCKGCTKKRRKNYYAEHGDEVKKRQNIKNRIRQDKNPAEIKARRADEHRKRAFGLLRDEYLQLLVNQNNSCAMCFTSFHDQRIVVDHDHSTNQVRGLLCVTCNVRLGILENKKFRRQAKKYLNLFK